jgi:hypothetical protein
LEEANTIAREIIDGNEDILSGEYSFNSETGVIEFSEEGLEKLNDIINGRYEAAYASNMMSRNAVLSGKSGVLAEDMSKEGNSEFKNGMIASGAIAAATSAALIGGFSAVLPVIGTSIGAILSAVAAPLILGIGAAASGITEAV